MIYPDIPIEKWLTKHPALREGLTLCECSEPHLRPYRTHKSAGIECTDCGAVLWMKAKDEDNLRFLALIT